MDKITRRYEIWLAKDCFEAHGRRPVIILSDDPESETVTVIPLTSIRDGTQLAAHIILTGNGLDVPSRALCNQVQSIDKQTLVRCVGCVHDPFDRLMLAHAVAVHLGLLNLHY